MPSWKNVSLTSRSIHGVRDLGLGASGFNVERAQRAMP